MMMRAGGYLWSTTHELVAKKLHAIEFIDDRYDASRKSVTMQFVMAAFKNNLTVDAVPFFYFINNMMHFHHKLKMDCDDTYHSNTHSHGFKNHVETHLNNLIFDSDDYKLINARALVPLPKDDDCFINNLYMALTDDGFLKKFKTDKVKKHETMLKVVRSCMTNLFVKYKVPLVAKSKSSADNVSKSKSKSSSSSSSKAVKFSSDRPRPGLSSEPKVKSVKPKVKKEKTKVTKTKSVKKEKIVKSVKETKTKTKTLSKTSTVAGLRALAASCGVVGRSKMVKDELIKALKKC
jgi:hypothetical protein